MTAPPTLLHTPAHPRQRRKESRPRELLDAALELFVEKGFAATRSEEVALRAGVSKGTLYLYFPSKEELFKAVVRHNVAALIAEGQEIADRHEGSMGDLLRLLLAGWWQHVGFSPAGAIAKVIIAEVRNFPDLAQFYLDEVIIPTHRLIGGTLQRGIDRGEFRPVPVTDAVHAIIAPPLFLAMHKHSIGACPLKGFPLNEGSVIDTQIDLVLGGLLVRSDPAPAPDPAPDPALQRPTARRKK